MVKPREVDVPPGGVDSLGTEAIGSGLNAIATSLTRLAQQQRKEERQLADWKAGVEANRKAAEQIAQGDLSTPDLDSIATRAEQMNYAAKNEAVERHYLAELKRYKLEAAVELDDPMKRQAGIDAYWKKLEAMKEGITNPQIALAVQQQIDADSTELRLMVQVAEKDEADKREDALTNENLLEAIRDPDENSLTQLNAGLGGLDMEDKEDVKVAFGFMQDYTQGLFKSENKKLLDLYDGTGDIGKALKAANSRVDELGKMMFLGGQPVFNEGVVMEWKQAIALDYHQKNLSRIAREAGDALLASGQVSYTDMKRALFEILERKTNKLVEEGLLDHSQIESHQRIPEKIVNDYLEQKRDRAREVARIRDEQLREYKDKVNQAADEYEEMFVNGKAFDPTALDKMLETGLLDKENNGKITDIANLLPFMPAFAKAYAQSASMTERDEVDLPTAQKDRLQKAKAVAGIRRDTTDDEESLLAEFAENLNEDPLAFLANINGYELSSPPDLVVENVPLTPTQFSEKWQAFINGNRALAQELGTPVSLSNKQYAETIALVQSARQGQAGIYPAVAREVAEYVLTEHPQSLIAHGQFNPDVKYALGTRLGIVQQPTPQEIINLAVMEQPTMNALLLDDALQVQKLAGEQVLGGGVERFYGNGMFAFNMIGARVASLANEKRKEDDTLEIKDLVAEALEAAKEEYNELMVFKPVFDNMEYGGLTDNMEDYIALLPDSAFNIITDDGEYKPIDPVAIRSALEDGLASIQVIDMETDANNNLTWIYGVVNSQREKHLGYTDTESGWAVIRVNRNSGY